ncbi:hypothetical protein EBBID32_13110 [Sphingobium indicum BiD32]|uniref:Uncharacterized protein n=1 Tax=Sphingobium indicum BiD32 TaxID=1301087 RepID=N1MMZ1_9SPHN|nr:hypothetical protein [Sphingobium indicum]CCW16972.1 hypothetical protein EBBID32_13110 [Sphingobium indicum BiD32]
MLEDVDNRPKADQTATRALAIVLMRKVMPLLDTLGEDIAAGHLQMAIDTVLGSATKMPAQGSC